MKYIGEYVSAERHLIDYCITDNAESPVTLCMTMSQLPFFECVLNMLTHLS